MCFMRAALSAPVPNLRPACPACPGPHIAPTRCRAFFPLSGQSLESSPLPDYSGVNQGASMEWDPLFGATLRCRQNDSDLVRSTRAPATLLAVLHMWPRRQQLVRHKLAQLGTCNTACLRLLSAAPPTLLAPCGWSCLVLAATSGVPSRWPCTPLSRAQVALDSVQYGRTGSFTINFWVKPGGSCPGWVFYLRLRHQDP